MVEVKCGERASGQPGRPQARNGQLALLARARGNLAAAEMLEKEVANLPNESPAWPDPMVLRLLHLRVGTFKVSQGAAKLEAQHRYAEAAKFYLQQIEQQPTAQNYVGAGLNLVRSGNVARGLRFLQTGISIDPERCDSFYSEAEALYLVAEVERETSTPKSPEVMERYQEAANAARARLN